MAWPGTPVRAAGRIPAGRIPARATERTSGPEARAQVRVFSPLADGLSQTMGRRGAGCHGWVGWHLQPYKHCWQGRRAPCDCLPTGKDPAIRQGPPPSGHGSVVPRPRARPHPSRFHATHSHPYLLVLYRPSPEGSPRTADTGALERGAWLGTTPGAFFCISWILTA